MSEKDGKREIADIVSRYLTLEQAAQYTGFTRATLQTWASRRVIPCIRGKRGRRFLRFKKDDLDKFLEQYYQKALNPLSALPEKNFPLDKILS